MKYLLLLLLLGWSINMNAQTELKPEKGGLILKVWEESFTTSDDSDNDIYFQFEDGTDIKYTIKKSKRGVYNRIMRKMVEFRRFHVKTGHHSSLRTNHSGWRLYKYILN